MAAHDLEDAGPTLERLGALLHLALELERLAPLLEPLADPIGHDALPTQLRAIAADFNLPANRVPLLQAAARLERLDLERKTQNVTVTLPHGAKPADDAGEVLLELEVVRKTVRRWIVPLHFDALPELGSYVLCGPAGAVWILREWCELDGREAMVGLEPVDPHDVPPTANVRALHLPVSEAVSA